MVTTWILILTLIKPYQDGPIAVQQTGPFATVEECQRAGNMWLHQMTTTSRTSYLPMALTPRAVCVQTTALEQTVTYGQ